MDKRWIAILVIIVLAIICGYYVAQNSPTVGNANADVDKSSITLPYGFSVGSSEATSLELVDKNTNEKIYIEDLGKGDSAESSFKSDLKQVKKEKEFIDEVTHTTNNGITIYIAHYIDLNNEDLKNQSIAYYFTNGNTYHLKLSGFENTDSIDEKITFIAENTHPDYKKSQDNEEPQEQSDLAVKYKRTVKSQD